MTNTGMLISETGTDQAVGFNEGGFDAGRGGRSAAFSDLAGGEGGQRPIGPGRSAMPATPQPGAPAGEIR